MQNICGKRWTLLISLLFLTQAVFGQDKVPYLLESKGEIPKEFITPSSEKYSKKLEKLENTKSYKQDKNKGKKTKQQFYLEAQFGIDEMLQSGHVLFNDELGAYITDVLNQFELGSKLKKTNPRVYVLNSSQVNAFATAQGIMFVTVGLLAKIENEAQLAFILAHELQHVEHDHSVNEFVLKKNIESGASKENLKKMGYDLDVLSTSLYSQKLEEEADAGGFELFESSQYSPETLVDIFPMLYYSNLTYSNAKMDRTFFDDQYFKVPADKWPEQANPISPMEKSEDSEESTHPSAIDRMDTMEKLLEGKDFSQKKNYLVSESRFHEVQKIARYQLASLTLQGAYNARALYYAFLMLRDYPDDILLQKTIGKALYYTSVDRRTGYTESEDFIEDLEGESMTVDHFLNQLENEELIVLALKYNYDLSQKYPEDQELQAIVKHLAKNFYEYHDSINDFSDTPPKPKASATIVEPAAAEPVIEKAEEEEVEDESMSAQIKKANSKKDDESMSAQMKKANDKSDEYWTYAFVDAVDSENFKKVFEEGKKDYEEREELDDYYDSPEGRKELRAENNEIRKNGRSLGIKKVVVVNPLYMSVDTRKDNAVQHIRSELKQLELRENLSVIGKKSDLKVKVLDVNDLKSSEVEKFNDIIEIRRYVEGQFRNFDRELTTWVRQDEIDAIAEKYGTDYFLWTGTISLRESNGLTVLDGCAAIVLPIYLPSVIYNLIVPNYEMLMYSLLFDLKTGRRSILKMDYFQSRDSEFLVKSHLYDVFYQINKKAKRK